LSVARQHIAALDAESLRAIEIGAHPAPFSVLGVQRAAGGRMLRVNAPGAWRVEARARRDQSLITVLDQSQTPGLFAAPFDSDSPYLLRVYWPGRVDEYEDPYSFPIASRNADLRAMRTALLRGAGEIFGAHLATVDGVSGVRFALWAPDTASVAVAGDFNGWSDRRHLMQKCGDTGVWELFIPRIGAAARYVFAIRKNASSEIELLVDPCAREIELTPRPAAIVAEVLQHSWRDGRFLAIRRARCDCAPPVSIYRIDPESWLAQEGRVASWRMLAERLPPFVSALGFTHIQIGRAEGDDSPWLFAPPPQFGPAADFAGFVDTCHEAGLGVIIEWNAPQRFAAAIAASDILVANILTDSALRWIETYHVDGLSMPASPGDPSFLRRVRDELAESAAGALLIVQDAAEGPEPAACVWSAESVIGALEGDARSLKSQSAAALERILLPVTPNTLAGFSPAEHTPDPLARLRAIYALAWLTPGMKLMHMGAELGQHKWPEGAVNWDVLDDPASLGFLRLVRDLNNTLRNEAPIRLSTRVSQTMTWIEADWPVFAYIRAGEAAAPLLVATNCSGETQHVCLETPCGGHWVELLNTDSRHYGGGDIGNYGGVHAAANDEKTGTFRLHVTLPPRGTIIFRNHA
jgi:1,4-alpha-glucan branching enzyme